MFFRIRRMIRRARAFIGQQPSHSTGCKSGRGVLTAATTGTMPLYSSSMQNLPPSSEGPEKSYLWWRHPFYRLRWKQWRLNWRRLAGRSPDGHEKGPAGVLRSLEEVRCDPDVALRLAFLVASRKPATKSELAGDNERQQRIKRKLSQAQDHLSRAEAHWQEQAAQLKIAGDAKRRQRSARKAAQVQNQIQKAVLELERALSEILLIFIEREDIDSLRTLGDTVRPENVDLLKNLIYMCSLEIEILLWPHAVELPAGHELFTLVSYVTACSGDPHFALVTELLAVAYQAYDPMRPATDGITERPTQEAIEKQVQRFRKLKLESGEDSILPDEIAESTAQRVRSGELRRELLTWYPAQALP